MLWLLCSKMEKEAAICSYAWLIQEKFSLAGNIEQTRQHVIMEQKMSYICRWSGMA